VDEDGDFKKWLESVDPMAEFARASLAAESVAPTLVGLDEGDAKARVESEALVFRVVLRDGVGGHITLDRRPNRINVAIENSTITSAEVY
jgi:hypothetical protein